MVARAVDRRADQLHSEYIGKAKRADQQFGGTEKGEVGRVERKLLTFSNGRRSFVWDLGGG